jgi:hypothetical protein
VNYPGTLADGTAGTWGRGFFNVGPYVRIFP